MSSVYHKRKWRHFLSLPDKKSKIEYLLKGEVLVTTWFNMDQHKEFFRPTLNDLFITLPEDAVRDRFKEFESEDEAYKYGLHCKQQLQQELLELIKN